jgi:hypothetical protein
MWNTPADPEARRVASSILQYLLRHPEAKDTREGIATWWVRQHEIERAVQEIFAGLNILLADGLVVELPGPGPARYYAVNAEQRDAIGRFLGQPGR